MIVADRKTCDRWIAEAPLGDPVTACGAITQLIESLEERPPKKPDGHLEVLECLRRPIVLTIEALAARLNGRPLPLSEGETNAFAASCRLYLTYGRAYRSLVRTAQAAATPAFAGLMPLMVARAIECSCELITMHYRVRREISPEHWRELHELYRLAESLGIAATPVSPGTDAAQSCSEVYIRALLISLASPYGMTPRALEWTRRWVRRWASKAVLTKVAGTRDCVPVDLAGDIPPRARVHESGADEVLRFLDVSAVRRSVKSRIRSLEQGEDPQALGLGSDGTREELIETLRLLYQQWFEAPITRQFKRRAVSSRAEVIGPFVMAHSAMCDTPPTPQKHEWEFSRVEWERLYVTGSNPVYKEQRPAPVIPERWELLEESAMGFRMRRASTDLRLLYRQLIGIRVEGNSRFILSEIRWLTASNGSTVTIGVRNLPGLPVAVWVRPTEGAPDAGYRGAFALPSGPNEPASLVLPGGVFKPDLELDLKVNESTRRVSLKNLVSRGVDFDRVGYSVLA